MQVEIGDKVVMEKDKSFLSGITVKKGSLGIITDVWEEREFPFFRICKNYTVSFPINNGLSFCRNLSSRDVDEDGKGDFFSIQK